MQRLGRDNFAYKITLMTVVASGMAVVTLMTAFLAFDYVSARSQVQSRLATLADILGQNSTAALDFEDRSAALEVLNALRAETQIVSGCLYDRTGRLFAEYQRHTKSGNCPSRVENLPAPGREFCAVTRAVERGEFDGTLYLLSNMHEAQKRGRHLLQVTGVLFLLAVVVGGVSGSLLQRKISKPIYALAVAMHEVTKQNNFSARVPVSGNDEIAQLGTGFNQMLSELENRAREKKKAEEQLQHQALNDELTGLPNRRLLKDRLTQSLEIARRDEKRVALLYIDLDGFKLVNDSLGHTVGDILLCQVADRLRLRVRRSDTLARLGGDEFAALLIGLDAKEQAGHVAHKLLEALTHPFQIEEHEITISACVGVSLSPDNGESAADLLQQADSAMYAAKRAGKNRMTYFTEDLGTMVKERLNLENQLRAALAHGEIQVHYQPEFEVGSHQLVRFEALARWTDPTLGTIPPAKFIPVAEESGLIVPLGAYIMEMACTEAARWQTISPHPVQVAVNVSSIQFGRDMFVDEVAQVLHRTGLNPSLLQIELTESVMLNGAGRAAEMMNRLHALGVSLAIDDFGTGYSCLGYLPKLPFDALKIDRSFVNEIGSRPEIKAMVHSLVTLAHNLGMRVIVEGIETVTQLDLVTELGSNEVQGFLLGRPTADPELQLRSGVPNSGVSVESPHSGQSS